MMAARAKAPAQRKKAPEVSGTFPTLEASPAYSVTALSIAMLTPGPMVELSATFFM